MLADAPGAVARNLLAQDSERVLAALTAPGDQNEGIHAARKAIRHMRAVLALLDEDEFELEREDRSLRRLGKSLSALRNAHVVVETAERLQTLHPGPGWATVVDALEVRRTRVLQHAVAVDPHFARRRTTIARFLQRLQSRPWDRLRRRHVRAALARSERRVKKAAARAASDGDAEAIHRWRRRVRRLRMQLDAAQALGALNGHAKGHVASSRKAKALHKTSDELGWLQDLQLLRNLVRRMPAGEGKAEVLLQIDRQLDGVNV